MLNPKEHLHSLDSIEDVSMLYEFVCFLYCKRSQISEVNELRYRLFWAIDIELSQLKPCWLFQAPCFYGQLWSWNMAPLSRIFVKYSRFIWWACLLNIKMVALTLTGWQVNQMMMIRICLHILTLIYNIIRL